MVRPATSTFLGALYCAPPRDAKVIKDLIWNFGSDKAEALRRNQYIPEFS
jgi:hypothetical protein